MRTIAALALVVSLTNVCRAEDWASAHDAGLEAVQRRDFASAIPFFLKSEELAQSIRQHALSANDLGVAFYQSGRDGEARNSLRAALNYWRQLPDESIRFSQTAGALATVERLLGDYGGAEALLRDSLQMSGTGDSSRSYLMVTLGDILREQGKFAEARPYLQQSLSLAGSSWRPQFNSTLALAELERDTKNWDASEQAWNRAAEVARQHAYKGGEAACIRGLGQTWLDRKNLSRAEPLLKNALALYESEGLRDDGQIAVTLTSLGDLYLAEDKTGMAEETLGRALAIDERTLGPTHPQVALVLEALAESFAIRNQADLARSYLDRAQSIMAARFGEQSSLRAGVLANWGVVERRMNHPDLAAAQFRKALDTLGPDRNDPTGLRSSIVRLYAEVLKQTHHKQEAEQLLAGSPAYRQAP
jgi:tetratricopeptide (TPR) repeat protein